MATLTPVDNDPFAAGAPASPNLTPVDHDPFSQPPAAIASGPLWNRPAGVSLSDQLMANLAAPFKGGDQAANDYGRVASNALTLGGADRLQSWLTGNTLAQEQKNTADARARLGAMAPITEAAIYALGPGELGVAGRLGGGVLGSAGEMATAGALAGANQSSKLSDVPLNMAIGAGVGALGGGAAGAAGKYLVNPAATALSNWKGALATPEDITKTALADRTAAYGALKTVDVPDAATAAANAKAAYDAADPSGTLAPRTGSELKRLQQRIDMAGQTISGQDAANWLIGQKGTMEPADYADAWTQLQKTGQISFPGTPSAHDLVMSLQKLDKIQGPNAGPENELAPMVQGHLQSALDDAGAGPLQDAADAAHKTYKNAQFLQNAGQNLQLLKQSPAGEAADIAQTYYRQGAADLMANRPTPEAAAFKSLAGIATAGGGGMSGYGAMHAMAPMVDLATAGAGGFVGGPTGAVIGEHAGNLVNYGLLKPGAGKALGAMSRAATQKAINAAYPDLTGRSVTAAPVDVSSALRALLFGATAPP